MNPTLEQLARYVVQELQRGVPEVALYAALRESGWTQDWISAAFSTAKQRAMPVTNQLNIPSVQQRTYPVQARAHHSMRPVSPEVETKPKAVRSLPKESAKPTNWQAFKKALFILIIILGVVVLALSVYRTVNGMRHAAAQRVTRDADRREDLSVLLSNLSDYFLTHNSYPTRTQLNTAAFLHENGFSDDSVTDPKWSDADEACTKDGRPILAGVATPSCYTYEVKTSKDGVCNNGPTAPCTKVKVTIYLEVDKQPYSVTFDKNTQI